MRVRSFSIVLLLWVWAIPSHGRTVRHPAIAIGRDTLTREAIRWQLVRDRCQHDTTATRASALAELVSSQLEYAVLKEFWHEEPPDSAIRITAGRLPLVTHDSAALACIGALGDSSCFLAYYVRPTLVNPRLHARYYSDTNIHRAARDSILSIFRQLTPHPELFLTHPVDTILIKRRTGAPLHSPLLEKEGEPETLPIVHNVLSKLGPRRVWPQVIESDFDFSIVMLDTVTDSIYRALAIRVAKQQFDLWFRDYVTQFISIHFLDRKVEAEFRMHYPKLWWLHSMYPKRGLHQLLY